MSKTFSTTQFELAHGRKPRGWGQWAFINKSTGETFFSTGTFTEAKKAVPAGRWEVGS